ncbi:LPS assembly lipoprotein LptE [Caballeronia sp. LZ062]|uniref:LPS-assembly lipoprotein LptE n=1 Tax=unclassified Caballeronia TaxID=2646786 RepID=UPI00285A1634|nr:MULTISPECIES: LPS assembly lipoprotein LptE [unclassified Caballeronia]MDR5855385.1 LPS assembly lipoprotein LptE [Caballeronia sp. LZ050]MDR5870087.1 LPS assembly lipoprotein LptE [Caballeronia sp. LZ062]
MSRRSFLALLGGAVALSACGFQLRGQQDYAFKRLAINGGAPQMVGRLERMVQGGSDTVIVKASEKPDATLFLNEGQGVTTLSLNSEGVIQEYELVYNLGYTLVGADGVVLIPPSTIALNRAMTYSNQYTLGKSQEATLLFNDMRNDAVDQLTRRLAVVRSLHPTPAEQTPGIAPRAPLPTPPL